MVQNLMLLRKFAEMDHAHFELRMADILHRVHTLLLNSTMLQNIPAVLDMERQMLPVNSLSFYLLATLLRFPMLLHCKTIILRVIRVLGMDFRNGSAKMEIVQSH